ncbi:hypothetical protein PIB30_018618 [Stylosanthes scabra]|uniref:Uncharacterized protein n=1 Tax=Stylosanthes scabra TaxID=79078 RepID=A0ABU6T8T0_9FABA|nr:hypothetical protein [Stylosanthes scabra]
MDLVQKLQGVWRIKEIYHVMDVGYGYFLGKFDVPANREKTPLLTNSHKRPCPLSLQASLGDYGSGPCPNQQLRTYTVLVALYSSATTSSTGVISSTADGIAPTTIAP